MSQSDLGGRRRSSGVDPRRGSEPQVGSIGLLIYEAARQGSLENLEFALNREGAPEHVNYRNRTNQMTPLMIAARHGHLLCVKRLICHSADINATIPHPKHKSQKQTAADLALKAGYQNVYNYLQGCIDDLIAISTTRAHLEADVISIASSPGCTYRDGEQFCSLLKQLCDKCNYQLEGEGDEPSLLIRAAEANNSYIVYKLIEEFLVSLYSSHPATSETALHFACQHMSLARFYLTHKCEGQLLFIPDQDGRDPLHVACINNDLKFVSWVFGRMLNRKSEDREDEEEESSNDFVPISQSLNRVLSVPRMHLHLPHSPLLSVFHPRSHRIDHCMQRPTASLKIKLSGWQREGKERGDGSGKGKEAEGDPAVAGESSSGGERRGEEEHQSITVEENGSVSLKWNRGNQERGEVPLLERVGFDQGYATSEGSSSLLNNGSTTLTELDEPARQLDLSSSFASGSSRTLIFEASTDSEKIAPEADFFGTYPHPPPVTFKVLSGDKLFRKNVEGKSIFHVLAGEGHLQLLKKVLKVAEIIQHTLTTENLDVLTEREGFTRHIPIEEALLKGNLGCVRVLLDFARKTKRMKKHFLDEGLLKIAVFSKKVDAVKLLLEFGFYHGLVMAITVAVFQKERDILRILLYYHTMIVNALHLATVHPNNTVSLSVGAIKWDELNLQHIDVLWLRDTFSAIEFISRIFNDPVCTMQDKSRYEQQFFRQLGVHCLDYCTTNPNLLTPSASLLLPISSLSSYHLIPIKEVNLSENQLHSVPTELFQMPHVRILQLNNNELQELPTSTTGEAIYTSPRLRQLFLDWNKLQTIPEDLCHGLGNSLEELNISFNELTDLPPGIWVMKKLRRLTLEHNQLHRLHYFSEPKYFFNGEVSRKIVASFEASHCGLQRTESGRLEEDQEYMRSLEEDLIRLASFIRTLHTLREEPYTINPFEKAIDIHWQRFRHLDMSLPLNSRPTTDIETCSSVEEDKESLMIQNGLSSLQILNLSQNNFVTFPWDLPCLAPSLQRLDLRKNKITHFDIIHSPPTELSTLWLSYNIIANTMKQRAPSLPCGSPLLLLSNQPERNNTYCTHCHRFQLENLTNLALDHNCLVNFEVVRPRLGSSNEIPSDIAESYDSIIIDSLFPRLCVLSLANNFLDEVPRKIHKLTMLSSLNLSFNAITSLPEEMGKMDPHILLNLQLTDLFLPEIPPSELQEGNGRNIICYLKSIREKSRVYRRIKLMVVGEANKGKTSLLLSLTRRGKMTPFKKVALDRHHDPLATDGVELGDWEYAPARKEKVTFMTWDFGGQDEYYATHQVFLTDRSLYLLVWDITDKETGLHKLRHWMENIESRARGSPVIVIATHVDVLPSAAREEIVTAMKTQFKQLYICCKNKSALPCVYPYMQVVNCKDSRQVDRLRDFIYDYVIKYRPPSPPFCQGAMEPLLEQKIPEAYITLQDTVRRLAQEFMGRNRVPIVNRKEYWSLIRESGEFPNSLEEDLDQATHFLHSNGILLHFKESQLNHLYFLNPQWLCSMLANVITVRQRNPHIKDGIISMANLHRILHSLTSSLAVEDELISLMQKFGVMLKLDEERLIIPSLLPTQEQDAYVVLTRGVRECESSTRSSFPAHHRAPISTHRDILSRYYLIPFIPNGFFPRLIAQTLSSPIASRMREALTSGPLEDDHILNTAHWECWRGGISLIWSHLEILRMAPLTFPFPGTSGACLVSGLGVEHKEGLKGVEIKVAVLAEQHIHSCAFLSPGLEEHGPGVERHGTGVERHGTGVEEHGPGVEEYGPGVERHRTGVEEHGSTKSRCLATWLLQQAIDLTDSVFEDWYEGFGRKRNLDYSFNCMTSPCPKCSQQAQDVERTQGVMPRKSRPHPSPGLLRRTMSGAPLTATFCLFSVSFCCHALTEGRAVQCPTHGKFQVSTVAPDLVFADLPPSSLHHDPTLLQTMQRLGDGGFGTVSLGLFTKKSELIKVAVKEYKADMAIMNCRVPELEGETRSWEVYQAASLEGRILHQLNHPHILSLIGVMFRPIRLLLELAPKGDLKSSVRKFQKACIRLNRWTLKATMIQTAEALDYLHSQNIIFRDLKPGNILVWQYPSPTQHQNSNTSVLIKLADYGVSKKITPLGILGQEGTPHYLPPEVLLHGGQESYSVKLDVYSFGMLMYYLFAFKRPFGNHQLIASLLREQRRPELPPKLWPHSLQMLELMCWCWSEKPQHRPAFSTILSTLRRDTITSLVGGTPISRDDDEVHVACVKCTQVPVRRDSSFGNAPRKTVLCDRLTELIPTSHSGIGLETAVDVWYATSTGRLSMVRYHSGGTTLEHINRPLEKYMISSILYAGGCIWLGTHRAGICVYDSNAKQPVAVWGETERNTVFQLISIEDTFSVLALTDDGLFVFPASNIHESSVSVVCVLVPIRSRPNSGMEVDRGVYIPRCGDLAESEVWVCTEEADEFEVLCPTDLGCKESVALQPCQGRKIRCFQQMLVEEKCYVFVSERHFIQMWDVAERRVVGTLDCHALLHPPSAEGRTHTHPISVRRSRVTSLAVGIHTVYIGTGAGTILIVNAHTLQVTSRLEAYTMPVRSLFVVRQMKPFSQMFSTVDTTASHLNSSVLTSSSSSSSLASFDSSLSLNSLSLRSFEHESEPPDSKCVLMSFGLGYRRIVGDSKNCDNSFITPYGYTPCTCCNHFFTSAKPSPSKSYLLLWSTESTSTHSHDHNSTSSSEES